MIDIEFQYHCQAGTSSDHVKPYLLGIKLFDTGIDPLPVFRIRWIRKFLGLPDPNPLVRVTDPDPVPSIIK